MAFLKNLVVGPSGSDFRATGTPLQAPTTNFQANQAGDYSQWGLGRLQDLQYGLAGQNGLANQRDVYGQQQGLANQLGQMAQGGGPNPALAQFNQATGQNVANQAALMAGQRGSGANVGLLARQIGQQGANTQQQAAGQAATLQAQQQLASIGALQNQQQMLGGLAGQQVGQQQAGLNSYNQTAQGLQQQYLNAIAQQNNANVAMQGNINSTNSGVQAANAQMQGQIAGGLLQGAGTAAGALAKSKGGTIPGKANVSGDSLANDTKPAMLSPGEIVIPRSIVMGPDAPKKAALFVAKELLKQKKLGNKSHFYAGGMNGDIPDSASDEDMGQTQVGQAMAPDLDQHLYGTLLGANSAEPGQEASYINPSQAPDQSKAFIDQTNMDIYNQNKAKAIFDQQQAAQDIATEQNKFLPAQQTVSAYNDEVAQAKQLGIAPPLMPEAVKQAQAMLSQQPQEQDISKQGIKPASMEVGPQDQSQGVQQGQQMNMPQAAGYSTMMGALNAQQKAASDLSTTLQGIADDRSKVLDDYNNRDQDRLKRMQGTYDQLDAEAKKKIDPNNYIDKLSTVGKISTVLGLIAGGIGGGLTHTENMAAKMLNSNIDRDIEAQRNDQSKNMNLYRLNLEKYKDEGLATQAAKLNALDRYANDAAKAEAKYKGSEEGARIAMFRGQIQQQASAIQQDMARKMMFLQGNTQQSTQQDIPKDLEPRIRAAINAGLVSPEDGKKMLEEAGTARIASAQMDDALKSFDEVAKTRGVAYKLGHPLRTISGAQSNQFNADLAQLNKTLTGRFNLEENKVLAKQIKPGDFDTDEDVALKREGLIQLKKSANAFPTLKSFQNIGLDPDNFSSTTTDRAKKLAPRQRRILDIAQRSGDPNKIRMVKTSLGL